MTEDNEMVERVAKAILESTGYLWELAPDGTREEFEVQARAAIAAMRGGGERTVADLEIQYIGGNCPVQAEGMICGVPFYFRARGRRWSLGIGRCPDGHGDAPEGQRPDWYIECFCTEWSNAGWMSEAEARHLILWCAAEYARGRQISPVATALDPAAVSDRANSERLLEPDLGPEGVA